MIVACPSGSIRVPELCPSRTVAGMSGKRVAVQPGRHDCGLGDASKRRLKKHSQYQHVVRQVFVE